MTDEASAERGRIMKAGCCDKDTVDEKDPGAVVTGPDGAEDGGPATVVLSVPGINCVSCIRHIRDSMRWLNGIDSIRVDLDSRQVAVDYHPELAAPEQFVTVIESAGYAVENDRPGVFADAAAVMGAGRLGPALIGLAAASAVIVFYLGLITLTSDWYYAKYQFGKYLGWIIALAAGLGVQAGLYSFFRGWFQGKAAKAARARLAASGGMSTAAMAVCCSHYLVTILPALGLPFLTAAAASLERYQTAFFLVGVLSNLAGIIIMLRLMSRSNLISFRKLKRRFGLASQ